MALAGVTFVSVVATLMVLAVAFGLPLQSAVDLLNGRSADSSVTVKEARVSAGDPAKLVELCGRLGDQEQVSCLMRVVKDAIEDGLYAQALPVLKQLDRSDPDLRRNCHKAFHDVGEQIIQVYMNSERRDLTRGEATALAMSELDSTACAGSMAHGIAEAFAKTDHNPNEFSVIMSRCSKVLDGTPGVELGCAHGIGHALALSKQRTFNMKGGPEDYVFTMIKGNHLKVLMRKCQDMTEGRNDAGRECAFGVMMQTFAPLTDTGVKLQNPEKLVETCAGLREDIEWGCSKGLGFGVGVNVSNLGVTLNSVTAMLSACSDGAVQQITDPHDPGSLLSCQTQVLNHWAYAAKDKPASDHADLCADLEKPFGRGVAVRCVFEAAYGVSEARYSAVVAAAGDLGAEALRVRRDG